MPCYCTVVTGAASGIGYVVAARLLSLGRSIVAVDLNEKGLKERFGDNDNVRYVACDLTSAESLKVMAEEIKGHFDGVDGFVHAAGVDMVAPLGMISADSMQRLFAIHTVFPVQFLGWMSRKLNHGVDTSAVLISSLSTHEGAKGHVAYAAAKGGVEGFLKAAAAELITKGIRLNTVVLGVVDTEMSRKWIRKLSDAQQKELERGYPLGLGRPEDVASVVEFLLSPSAKWITGQMLVCDGGHMLV